MKFIFLITLIISFAIYRVRMKKGLRTIVLDHLDPKEADEFAKWAVGDSFNTLDIRKWPSTWNFMHGDLLRILDEGNPQQDLPKMIEIWKKYERKKT